MSYTPRNPNGQATMANSQPVVLASDESTLPVTANAGTNLNTSLLALESGGNLATIAGKDFATQTTLASLLTSSQLIDDPVMVLGTATYTEATSKGFAIAAVRRDADTTLVDTTNEFAPLIVDARGLLKVEAFSGETLPVSLTSTTITGTVAVTKSGTWDITNAGTFAVQVDGAALTSLQLSDDVVYTDDTSTHATGTSKGTGIMAVANPTDAAVDANDIGMVAMTLARALKNDITTIAGTAPTTAGFIDIKGADGNVFVRQATASNLNMTEASAASILTSVQLIDDMIYTDDTSTHATGTSKGALMMAAATPTDTAVNANDIGALAMTLNRELLVQVNTALPAGTNAIGKLSANSGVIIGDVNIVSNIPGTGATALGKAEDAGHTTGDTGVMSLAVRSDAGATGNPTTLATTSLDYIPLATDANNRLYTNVAGDLAHDAADSTSAPIKIGGQARQTNPTAVADADRVNAMFDDVGRQVTVMNTPRDLKVSQTTTITSSTSETTILTAGASGVFHDITMITVANTSATATRVDFRDATGGSVIFSIYCEAGKTTGFVVDGDPLAQTTAANNWTAQCGTSVADVRIFIKGFKTV